MTHGPVARFKELCLDTTSTDGVVGRFWAAATGCRFTEEFTPGSGDVVGEEEGMGIAICPVPEVKTVKNRVHLDVLTSSIDELTALGARVLREPDDEIAWTVLADPEGNEFCAFHREQPPSYRVMELAVDAADPVAITSWWGEVFGVPVHSGSDPWRWLEGVPEAPFEAWVFAPVPEPKTVKNRLHWDVYGDVDALLDRGATRLWEMPRWTVLADPEGNEFCVFPER